jgi:hypothetical protein
MAMRRILAAAVLLLWSLGAAAQPSLLDGTSWSMRYRKARGLLPIWKADRLSFQEGRFADTECGSYGFEASPYAAAREGDGTVWTATQFNADGERAEWRGRLEGERMEGTLLWVKPDGESRLYRFSATRRED